MYRYRVIAFEKNQDVCTRREFLVIADSPDFALESIKATYRALKFENVSFIVKA